MAGISDLLGGIGAAAKAKVAVIGASDSDHELLARLRSLNIEHVSPAVLKKPEISHRTISVAADGELCLASMRRWFFARKPDAGFVLTGFPATLLQCLVLDEWLDCRNESLAAVFAGSNSDESVLQHYRTLGLLYGPEVSATL